MSGPRVGVAGDDSLAESVEAAGGEAARVSDGDDDVSVGDDDVSVGDEPFDAEALEEIAYVVAAGESAVVDLARGGVPVPVLPVDADTGVGSVPRSAVDDALEQLLDGAFRTVEHPVVAATTPYAEVRALFDVALMAAEPARISEFSVSYGDERVGRFRADGVVASTPAGSPGYNRAADGPLVAPGTDVVAVVPVAPFATHADHWVLPIPDVAMAVERDETPVELLADGRPELSIADGDTVRLSRDGTFESVVVPESEGVLLRDGD